MNQPLPDDRLAIISAPGSRGDVNPMLKLGAALRERGWEVLFVGSEPYAPLAEQLGLRARSLIDSEEFDAFINHPDLWHWYRGTRYLLSRTTQHFLQPMYELLLDEVRPGRTVVINHPLDFGSRVYRDTAPQVPLVSVHLAPCMLRNREQPSKMTPLRFEPRRPPLLGDLAYWFADRVLVAGWFGNALNAFRKKLGLGRVKRPLLDWWLSPDRLLGFYEPWFVDPAAPLPRQLRMVGFPLADLPELIPNSPPPPPNRPFLFTAGTAQAQSRAYFDMVIAATAQLGLDAVLLTGFRDQLPTQLPEHVSWQRYVALSSWLPQCRGIAHHGGIGTTSWAMASGTPQLITPMAFDQFDNAERVVQRGAGLSQTMASLDVTNLVAKLRRLLDEPHFRDAAEQLKGRMTPGAVAVSRAADEVERLASASFTRPVA